ncbi:LLM class flavin-dependent oxidoreductase [Streptomyces acidiscabies]|uniref:LLM class flavin-dependent oxidoreductase n=1 Tax=Streptomyces acidiscabies TaxID=42234 RepID=A0AAP6B5D7_9ACTN|nr:LLM class flavin-dependent oxidoreductase [Streptomyces acidiscabies]MBP5941443.1 LLM class flavin-dependent oxidoreductase [Streptomyces sp. LBUM 1476]MBZ3912813.1 LLM class flavin-dependent oxidoreductase [Streptomyces acidiscabies]MDX2958297.1 LLM class flavin-dependent oxidoreductase [Streptomyces acidiscabies]MDX3018664.1 LLM class flavin-dependent oxidoreductase [Streptomyces acidiscabies]MDX3791033.1 LLM class flavin-dependent oxidoreductase [Streptomyces acidiscabies]
MEFGIVFFPTVGGSGGEPTATQYYDDGLYLAQLAEQLGYHQVKLVEHYFFDYGGYSPDPITFLAAVAARTSRLRVATGAVIPAFTHPVKLAGQLAMLDNISGGRLDVGFGRAFLPDEFAAFGIPLDESRARFEEGVEACVRLWTEDDLSWEGSFHKFGPLTMLPKPAQQPHPPVFVASTGSLDSCRAAGEQGHHLQLIAAVATREKVQEALAVYRGARAAAGYAPGTERIDLTFPCFVDEDREAAYRLGEHVERKLSEKMGAAVSAWATVRSDQYPGYDRMAAAALGGGAAFDERVKQNKILAGTPDDVRAQLAEIADWYGDGISVGLSVHSGQVPRATVEHGLRLFAEHVAPAFTDVR